jgi:Ser-tRNA(Ala) deacylase AlaX
MAVIKVFWQDPYLTKLAVKVTSIDGNLVTVDRTIAYAFAGGQESDHGSIGGFNIVWADKQEQEIVYQLEEGHSLKVGDEVPMEIDWERRYKLMRLHFAAELVLELVTQNYNSPTKIGAHIAQDKARVDFEWQGNISATFPLLQEQLSRLVGSNLPITSEFSDVEKEIRYWEIENFAKVLCGGTHLKSTGEVGPLALKRNNIGKGKERIEIILA